MTETTTTPRLRLSHTTMAVRDLEAMLRFYCDTLGFHVTNRGSPAPGAADMAFISQDPSEHHQIVFVQDTEPGDHAFVMADHMAFRTDSLDSLRAIGARLAEAGVDDVIPIDHGNAWSLYFTDPEGNGLECFVDSPFHVAQPYAGGLDLSAGDEDIAAATAAQLDGAPEFQPIEEWRSSFTRRLDAE
ncbi:MAG: VOC family protein [Actinomycetota bacterium]